MLKIDDCPLKSDFAQNAKNLVVVCNKNRNTKIVAHDHTYNGYDLFSIREIYLTDGGEWAPTSKAASVPAAKKAEFLAAIVALAKMVEPAKPAPAPVVDMTKVQAADQA